MITEAEWDFIMQPIWKSGLPKIELASNFPSKVLYGPKKIQGMGIMHPFYTQEMSHLSMCLYEGKSKTITGELIRASMEQLQLELGFPAEAYYSWIIRFLTNWRPNVGLKQFGILLGRTKLT